MDLRKLKTIFDLFENSSVSEMEITEGEEKLRLVKHSATTSAHAMPVVTMQPAAVNVVAPPPPGAPPAPAAEIPVIDADDNLVRLESPMVGTYHAKPSEEEAPYVAEGAHVLEGDTVCMIEAMKLFNNVGAPVSGTVRKVAAVNEQPVGFGELLMLIEPDD